jgi:hypothetical protein
VALSQNQNEQPIILIFPDQFSLDLMRKYGRLPHQPLVNFLEKRGYTHLDLGSRFASHDYGEYYNFYNSHFSPRGNERVAEELIALIKRLDEEHGTF